MPTLSSRTEYNKILDLRTVRKTTEQLYPVEFEELRNNTTNKLQHDALADCVYQVEVLGGCMDILGGDGAGGVDSTLSEEELEFAALVEKFVSLSNPGSAL